MHKAFRLLAMAATVFLLISPARADEPFYEGQRLTVMVNYAPGGATDIEGRLVARHLARHIPGQPGIVVRNMPGAGGLVATNHLGEAVEPDGLTMAYYTAVYEYQLLEDPALRVDLREFGIVGATRGVPINYIRKDVEPGMERPTDIVKAKFVLGGGLRPVISKDLLIRMSLDLLGVENRVVTGFSGNAPVRQAVQQNEVQFYAESIPAYLSIVKPTMVDTGIVIPVYHHELWENGRPVRSPDVPDDIPTFYELYEQIKGEAPSGPLYEAYNTINKLSTNMLRLIALPPKSPAEALDALRTGLAALKDDPEFKDDAMKTLNFVPQFIVGNDAEALLNEQLGISEAMRSFLQDYVARAAAN